MSAIRHAFLDALEEPVVQKATLEAHPQYWASDPERLTTTCNIGHLTFGNGLRIYDECIIPSILAAEEEVILVTCFWARSETLNALNDGLCRLSVKAVHKGKTIRVRICLSSVSLFQKLFHTASLKGRVYDASTWPSTFGLPASSELPGLDLQVKSIFVLPFCVMHPKFVIVDRRRVLLPSCNVSWESWFEGCIELSGAVVQQFTTFWLDFWADDQDSGRAFPDLHAIPTSTHSHDDPDRLGSHAMHVPPPWCTFLPSPHHRNPRFTFPWSSYPAAPPTPLNIYLLALLALAKSEIYIQTPNLTSPPVLEALLQMLKRGVAVTIVTSERLMVLEQLVTAGTTTKRCVSWLMKQHQDLLKEHRSKPVDLSTVEAGTAQKSAGKLRIEFYEPRTGTMNDPREPVQSHLKLTAVDGRFLVLGSGNLDRASWFTSQELGVAFMSEQLVETTMATLKDAMAGRNMGEDLARVQTDISVTI